jgi:hypothetical protein
MKALKLLLFSIFISSVALARTPSPQCKISPFETALGEPTLAVQEHLCKADECGDISTAEAKAYDSCSIVNGADAIRQTSGLSGLTNDVAEGMVFQDLARNSHQQSVCRNEFLIDYENKPDVHTKLDAAAESAFNSIKDDLSNLIAYGAKVENAFRDDENEKLAARMSWEPGEYDRRKKEIDDIKTAIAQKVLAIPMGYDSDVSKSLLVMGAAGKFDTGAFKKAMARARVKYAEADKFYSSKFMKLENGQGTYCLWLDWRNRAGRSGQLRKYIEAYPANTPDEIRFKEKLTCRLTRTYECGQESLKNVTTVAAFAAGLIPPVRAAEAVGAFATATRAAMLATAALRGVAALDAAFSSQLLYDECLGVKLISSDRKACDPAQDFGRTVNGPKTSSCVIGLGTSALAILQAAKAAKDGVATLDLVGQAEKRAFNKALAQTETVSDLSAREAADTVGLVGSKARNAKERVQIAEAALGRKLTGKESRALERAHIVGARRTGAGYGSYTRSELKKKRKILRQAGYSESDANKILRLGIAGVDRKFAFGEIVYLERTDGSISKGRVIFVGPDYLRVEVKTEYGLGTKDVSTEEISIITGRVRSRAYAPGERVYIPRSEHSSMTATIVSIDPRDGQILVEFPDRGGVSTKWLKPEALRKAPQPNDGMGSAERASQRNRAYQEAQPEADAQAQARARDAARLRAETEQKARAEAQASADAKARGDAYRARVEAQDRAAAKAAADAKARAEAYAHSSGSLLKSQLNSIRRDGNIVVDRRAYLQDREQAALRVLGLERNQADPEAINAAWKRALIQNHPDKFTDPSIKNAAGDLSAYFNAARDILLNGK